MDLSYTPLDSGRIKAVVSKRFSIKNVILVSVVGAIAFFASRGLLELYYGGDPLYYQHYYDAIYGRGIIYAFYAQYDYLGSSEIVYPAIAWAASNLGIERSLSMAIFDGLMYSTLFLALRANRCNPAFIILLLTNYYILVIATSAERLKFSYIFLFIALLLQGRTRILWLALAPLAHFQTFITEGAIMSWHLLSRWSFRTKVTVITSAAVLGMGIAYYFSDALIAKFTSYQGHGGLTDVVPGLAVLILALVSLPDRLRAVAAIAPLICLTIVLGGDRMNMIIITTFLYIVVTERQTGNPFVLLLMLYLSVKSVGFVQGIVDYGNGFIVG